MIGIVVVSHGKLARELVAATEHVVGEQPCFRSISIEVEDDMSVMSAGNLEVLSGVNLPMLIKLAEVRESLPLSEAAKVAAEAGRKYISIASDLLAKSS